MYWFEECTDTLSVEIGLEGTVKYAVNPKDNRRACFKGSMVFSLCGDVSRRTLDWKFTLYPSNYRWTWLMLHPSSVAHDHNLFKPLCLEHSWRHPTSTFSGYHESRKETNQSSAILQKHIKLSQLPHNENAQAASEILKGFGAKLRLRPDIPLPYLLSSTQKLEHELAPPEWEMCQGEGRVCNSIRTFHPMKVCKGWWKV